MADNSPHLNKQAFAQGSNTPISTPNHTPEREETSHPSLGQIFEVTYNQLWTIGLATHKLARDFALFPYSFRSTS